MKVSSHTKSKLKSKCYTGLNQASKVMTWFYPAGSLCNVFIIEGSKNLNVGMYMNRLKKTFEKVI